MITALWTCVHHANPRLLGGCRPVAVLELLGTDAWRIRFRRVITRLGISSEIVVAAPR